jgi:hypothetical protein
MNTITRRRTKWAAVALLLGGTMAGGALTAVPAMADTNPPGIVVSVTGWQWQGSSDPHFNYTYLTPESLGQVTGSVTCTELNGNTPINSALPVPPGTDQVSLSIDPASCSGLTAPAGQQVYYVGGLFTVSIQPQVVII